MLAMIMIHHIPSRYVKICSKSDVDFFHQTVKPAPRGYHNKRHRIAKYMAYIYVRKR